MSKVWKILEAMQGEIAAQIRIIMGEPTLDQSMFDDAQRQRRIDSFKAVDPSLTDEERHDAWCKAHTDMGWVYSGQFDPVAKTHPMLRRWGRLSQESQCKARIFAIVAKAGQELESLKLCDESCQPEVVSSYPESYLPFPAPTEPPAPIAPAVAPAPLPFTPPEAVPALYYESTPVVVETAVLIGDSGSTLLDSQSVVSQTPDLAPAAEVPPVQ